MLENTQAVTQEALLKLDARSAEVQALVQSAVNSALGTFQRQTDEHADAVLSETTERAESALSSLDAESRATCEARRLALETEVARAAERSTDQFRKGMKAFLYSCLVAAVSAVDEHSKSTLDGLVKDNGKTLFESDSDSRTEEDGKSFRVPTLTHSPIERQQPGRPKNDAGCHKKSLTPEKKKANRTLEPVGLFLRSYRRRDRDSPEGVRTAVPACALAETRSSLNRQRAVAEPGRRNGLRAASSIA